MMNEFLLRSAFGKADLPDAWEFALLRAGQPINGYTRPTVARGAWTVGGDYATTAIRFGPARGALEFDAVGIYADTELVDTWTLGSMTLPPGMAFDFEASFDLPAA